MSRRFLGLVLGLLLLLPATVSPALADTVVFSKTYTVGWPTVLIVHNKFAVDQAQEATCVVTKVSNGKKFKSGFLWLNGHRLLGENDLRGDKTVFEIPVTLKAKNNFWLYWHGEKGAAVTLEFRIKKQALPPTAALTINPTVVTVGNSTTLTWTTQNADTVSIDNGVGTVAASGSLTVTPSTPTTYTLTAVNAVGQATAQAAIDLRANVAPQPEGSFGAQYQDLIPYNATLTAYDPKRFALATGRVLDAAGTPLAGVAVSVHNHTEYGTAHTDASGRYTLPLESSGIMTVVYALAGYLPAQRTVVVRWNDTAVIEDTVLLVPDAKATSVIFNGNPGSVTTHESTPVTDSYGKRSASLVFTGDNKAFEVDAAGNTVRELTEIKVSATEFPTPESMPAKLPPTSAFTWCGDMVVDGASRVRFDKPVVGWLDNFLSFAVGTIVPVGYYDRDKAVWVPSDNGVVAKLLDTDGDGVVDALDVDGDGQPDDLNGDGSFVDEVEGVRDPARYKPGETYWRFSMSHFTPWDCNFPYGPPDGATPPNSDQDPDADSDPEEDPCQQSRGSSLSTRGGIVHEDIPVAGTNMTLHYSSERVPGHKHVITVPVSGATIPDSLKEMVVQVTVAGRVFEQVLAPEPNKKVEIIWDGLDNRGKPAVSNVVDITIGFAYDAVYYTVEGNTARGFAQLGSDITGIRARQQFTAWKRSQVFLSLWSHEIAEGWSLSSHNVLPSPFFNIVYKGDGTKLVRKSPAVQEIVKGYYPDDLAFAPDGSLYFLASNMLYKRDKDGNISTISGAGGQEITADGISAADAYFYSPKRLYIDSNKNIFIVDNSDNKVFKLDADGIIRILAGTGENGYNGDGIPATSAQLGGPYDVVADGYGNVFIAEADNARVRKVSPDGLISTYVGTGEWPKWGVCPTDGALALKTPIWPLALEIDNQGALYISNNWQNLLKVDSSGLITVLGGCGAVDSCPQGGTSAHDMAYLYSETLAISPTDDVYFANWWWSGCSGDLYKIDSNQIIVPVHGHETLKNAPLDKIWKVAMSPDGNVCYTSTQQDTIKCLVINDLTVQDDNGQSYVFDGSGRHLRTLGQLTNKSLYEFGYNGNGHLASVTDRFGNVVVVERDGSGTPKAIVSPDGQRTTLTTDADNRLSSVGYADGGSYSFEYDAGGLMLAETNPNGNRFTHSFDASGRAIKVADPMGGLWNYTRTVNQDGTLYEDVSAEGLITSYYDVNQQNGYSSTITDPNGGEASYFKSLDGLYAEKTTSCGWSFKFDYAYDQRFFFPYEIHEEKSSPAGIVRKTDTTVVYTERLDKTLQSVLHTETVNNKATKLLSDLTASTRTLTTPVGRTTTVTYDPTTLLTASVAVPGLATTNFSYDARGRNTGQSAGTRSVSATYDTSGNVASVTGPRQLTTSFSYDDLGRRTAIYRPDNSTVRFTYDKMGNTTVLTTPSNVAHDFEYNAVNKNSAYDTPLSGSYVYNYDRDRRLTRITFPSSKIITRTYEDAQLRSIITPQYTVSYTYEPCGSTVKSLTTGTETITYGHDGPLVTSAAQSGTLSQTLTFAYNSDFKVKSLTYAGSANAYTYDNDNLLTGSGGYTISRDSQNGLPKSVSGNGLTESRTFSQYGELDAWTVTVGGNTAADYSLTRDAAGNIATRTETVAGVRHDYAYVYDNVGRLTQVTRDGAAVESYAYAGPGTGRTSETNTLRGLANRAYAYDAEDHLTSAGVASYTYDKDGFLTGKTVAGQTTGYQYSSRGELLQVDLPSGDVVTFVHDPLGRRIAKKVNGTAVEKYLWQGQTRLLAVYDGSGALKQRFEYADGRLPVAMTKGSTRYFLAYDQVGSLRAVLDGAGAAVKTIEYDSFGNVIADSDKTVAVPFGFAGGLFDTDTGLTRFGYRDYDADVGRWTAKDPIGFEGGQIDLYSYTVNDPINKIDTLGLQSQCGGGEIVTQILDVGPVNALTAKMLASEAMDKSATSGLEGMHNGQADAYRHCYWSCKMTQEMGESNAKNVGDNHEACANGQPADEARMDETNNETGRKKGATGHDCQSECMKALQNGLLQVSP